MKKFKAVYLLIVLLAFGCSKLTEKFQEDADIFRLRHIKYYGNVLDEYFRKRGKYPFQGEASVPLIVHIAHDMQEKYTKQNLPYEHRIVPLGEFVARIESGIGREMDEYYDPQYAPVNKPNFYIYMVYDNAYYFAVHLHQPFGFARRVSDHYYKLEISNRPDAERMIVTLEELLADSEFVEALKRIPTKEGFFQAREKKYLHYSKGRRAG